MPLDLLAFVFCATKELLNYRSTVWRRLSRYFYGRGDGS
jgi:hypothetical protein